MTCQVYKPAMPRRKRFELQLSCVQAVQEVHSPDCSLIPLPSLSTLFDSAGTHVTRSESQAATMVVSLLGSIAGGGWSGGAQSPAPSPGRDQNGFGGEQASGFGAQNQPPVFRSLSRTLSSTSQPAAVSTTFPFF